MNPQPYELFELLPVGPSGVSDLVVITSQSHTSQATAEGFIVPSERTGNHLSYVQFQAHMWTAEDALWPRKLVEERVLMHVRDTRSSEEEFRPSEVRLAPITDFDRIKALVYLKHYPGLISAGRSVRDAKLREFIGTLLVSPETELAQIWPKNG